MGPFTNNDVDKAARHTSMYEKMQIILLCQCLESVANLFVFLMLLLLLLHKVKLLLDGTWNEKNKLLADM